MANKMKFVDALRLSWTNIAEHKGRSAIIVLTISVLFGVLMGVNFIMNGLEKTLYTAALEETDGMAELVVGISHGDRYTEMIRDDGDLEQIDLSSATLEQDVQTIAKKVQQYGGEVLGETWSYQMRFPYRVVTASTVEGLLDVELTEVPEGKVPVFLPTGGVEAVLGVYDYDEREADKKQDMMDRLESALYQVGTTVSLGEDGLVLQRPSLLNLPLSMLGVGGEGNILYLVDDGSGKVEEFILEQMQYSFQVEDNIQFSQRPAEGGAALVRFADVERMVDFVMANDDSDEFFVLDWRSNVLDIVWMLKSVKAILLVLGMVSLVVALIIAVTTFAHLIDQDVATIALYRSMGASMGDVHLIYFLYLLELCILSVGACLLIAFGMVLVMTLLDAKALAECLQSFYSLSEVPQVWLWAFDGSFGVIVLAMLAVAPVSLIFAQGHFSSRNIAKQLKAD